LNIKTKKTKEEDLNRKAAKKKEKRVFKKGLILHVSKFCSTVNFVAIQSLNFITESSQLANFDQYLFLFTFSLDSISLIDLNFMLR